MVRLGSVWILLFVSSLLSAASLEEEGKEAEALYLSGKTEDAARRYQVLLQTELTPRQRAILQFNLATVLTEEGQWQRADELLTELQADAISADIRYAAGLNQSTLHLRRALAYLDDPQSPDAFTNALSAVQKGFEALIAASAAERSMIVQEGMEWGGDSDELVNARKALKGVLLHALELQDAYRLEHLTLEQGLEDLGLERKDNVARLQDLALSTTDPQVLRPHLEAIRQRALKHRPYWAKTSTLLQSKLQTLQSEQERQRAQGEEDAAAESGRQIDRYREETLLLTEAENQSRTATDWMEEGDAWKARTAEALSAISLQLIQDLERKADLLESILHQRVRLAAEVHAAKAPEAMQEGLREEDEKLLSFAYMLAERDRKQLTAHIDEHGGKEHDLLLRRDLSDLLIEWLGMRSVDTAKMLEQAERTLILYQQMRQPEEDLLLALWGESTDRVPVQDLQVLAERFDRRSKYTDAPDRATRVAATLRKAAAETRSSTAQARIEDALIDWAPDALLLRELQTLMQQYRPFSEGVKVSSKDFSGLDASYQRLGAWMPKIQAVRPQEGLYVAVANMVKAAESGTKQAEKESSSGHFDTAIFMLQGAREEIRLALASLRNARQLQSVLILSDAVDAQQFALRLNEALDRVGSMEGSRKVLLDQLKTSQNRALQQIEPFTQSAAQELKVDQDALKSDGLPSPWERVMALYDKGKESADNAKLSLFKEYPDTPKALSDQNDAYKRWREALDLLRPESNEGAPQDQDSDASEGEEQNRDSEERRPPSASTQQALQLLQQMEMEDAPKSEKPAGVKQGLRPW